MLGKWLFRLLFLLLVLIVVYYFFPETKLPSDIKIDKLVVVKSERKLIAYSNDKELKTYVISLGGEPKGHKQYEGDNRTPEGNYFINAKNPLSGYHKNLGISYPNEEDKLQARKMGKHPGGEIKIHGLRNGMGFIGKFHRWFDWTLGCMALTDEEVDELYKAVPIGTPIEIHP
jgi:murein L,D-transpeptidase YafK